MAGDGPGRTADSRVLFVANLYPTRGHIVGLQRSHEAADVVFHGREHLAVGHFRPRGGRGLASNRVPGVAKHEIDINGQPSIFAAYSHGDGLALTAVTILWAIGWIDKSAEPDSIDTVPLQDGEDILLYPCGIIELVAKSFHLWGPTNVCAFDKGRCGIGRGGGKCFFKN